MTKSQCLPTHQLYKYPSDSHLYGYQGISLEYTNHRLIINKYTPGHIQSLRYTPPQSHYHIQNKNHIGQSPGYPSHTENQILVHGQSSSQYLGYDPSHSLMKPSLQAPSIITTQDKEYRPKYDGKNEYQTLALLKNDTLFPEEQGDTNEHLRVTDYESNSNFDRQNDKNGRMFRYTRNEMINISKSSQSQRRPRNLPSQHKFKEMIIFDQNQEYYPTSWCNIIATKSRGPKHIDLGVTELSLAHSEDCYVSYKERLVSGEVFEETEELVRQIKGILNRIVPQNFDECLTDLVSLKVNTQNGMICLVNELFLKAVKEEAYSQTFATVCSHLSLMPVNIAEDSTVTFIEVLLEKCYAMFTTPLEEQLEIVRQTWLLKASNEKLSTKALIESDVEEQMKKAKDRYFGNIRFITELYLKGVLLTAVMCRCIENLIAKWDNSDYLISLCKLLESCGSKLESETDGQCTLTMACTTLKTFLGEGNIETRVRFRIKDMLEMRANNWCQRQVRQQQRMEPKTPGEIEDEQNYLRRKNSDNWNGCHSLPSANLNSSTYTPKQTSLSSFEQNTPKNYLINGDGNNILPTKHGLR